MGKQPSKLGLNKFNGERPASVVPQLFYDLQRPIVPCWRGVVVCEKQQKPLA